MGSTITAQEAAERLRVGRPTIWRWVRQGQIPTVKIPGTRTVRIPADALERLERGGR